ncbi:MAG: NAD(P)-dependent oxidoreductase [Lachnospiraceae bacterium]|nr:NAD(P)-dependent oxidoreductase [Lachnospiraceae bacterium]
MNKVIITGATGTIGMALIRRCIKNNIFVLAIVNPQSVRKEWLPKHPLLEIIEKDISEYNSLVLEESYDIWFHLAWCGASGSGRNDMYMQNRNVTYLLDAIHAAKRVGCHTFIGAGSQAEYGPSDVPLSPNSPTFPMIGYGFAKLCAGQMGKVLCNELNMRFIWSRIFSIFGPYDGDNTMIMTEIHKLLNGEVPEFTKGEQEWDYLYCDDAAEALCLIAEKGKDGKVYCLGSGQTRLLRDYIIDIRNVISSDLQVDIGKIPYSKDQVMHLCADISDLCKDTGFTVKTNFIDGIKETIKWVREKDSYEKN